MSASANYRIAVLGSSWRKGATYSVSTGLIPGICSKQQDFYHSFVREDYASKVFPLNAQNPTEDRFPGPLSGYFFFGCSAAPNSERWFLCLCLPSSVALDHAVAHADFGKDILGFRRILLDLAADVGHVHPQDLVPAAVLRSPEFLHDIIIGQHLAGIA